MKRAMLLAALLLTTPALAKDAASPYVPPQPVTFSMDGVVLTPCSDGLMELGPGTSAAVTPEGVMLTGGVVTLRGACVLVAPVRPGKAAH